MPRGDRTGPQGEGPRTGRQMGYCTGQDFPGSATPAPGFGYGRGAGRGLGRGRGGQGRGMGRGGNFGPGGPIRGYAQGPNAGPQAVNEKAYLESALDNLEEEVRQVKDRLKALTEEVEK